MCTNMVTAALQNRALRHPAVERWLEMPPRFEAASGGRVALALENLSLKREKRGPQRGPQREAERAEISSKVSSKGFEDSLDSLSLSSLKRAERLDLTRSVSRTAPHSARFAVRR